MVKVAFVGDIHLADKKYADEFSYNQRNHYVDQHAYVRKQIQLINAEKPDHVIFLGDLVDWFSKENINFALDIVNELEADWDLIPGNHDFQLPVSKWAKHNNDVAHEDSDVTTIVCRKKALEGWVEKEINLSSRRLNIGETSIYLLDSALGFIAEEEQEWFLNDIDPNRNNIITTHVPFPFAETINVLKENNKCNEGYYQINLSDKFKEIILSSVDHIFFGHVHFTAHYQEENVNMHMLKNANVPIPDSGDNGIYYLEI